MLMIRSINALLCLTFSFWGAYALAIGENSTTLRDYKEYYEESDIRKKAEMLESLLNEGLDESEFDLFQNEVDKIIKIAQKREDDYMLNYGRFLLSYTLIEKFQINSAEKILVECRYYFEDIQDFRVLGEIE